MSGDEDHEVYEDGGPMKLLTMSEERWAEIRASRHVDAIGALAELDLTRARLGQTELALAAAQAEAQALRKVLAYERDEGGTDHEDCCSPTGLGCDVCELLSRPPGTRDALRSICLEVAGAAWEAGGDDRITESEPGGVTPQSIVDSIVPQEVADVTS